MFKNPKVIKLRPTKKTSQKIGIEDQGFEFDKRCN
jgi:hypothetical protein